MILHIAKKTIIIIITLYILSTTPVFAEDERLQPPPVFYPSFSLGVGTTLDLSVHGIDQGFIHGLFVYSPFISEKTVLSLRSIILGNISGIQLRIPITVTFRLFHYQWGEISPFCGVGAGYSFIENSIFFFLHSGLDFLLSPRIILTIGNNLLFVGHNYLDTELILSVAFCF